MESQRRLLQELLGTSGSSIKDFRDEKVCRYYLAGLCPHELFANTKHHLGPCTKVHDDVLRQAYQEASKRKDYGYERDLEIYLEQIIHKLDRDIHRALQKVDEEIRISAGNTVPGSSLSSKSSSSSSNTRNDPLQAELAQLSKQIADLLQESETAGARGEVIKSFKLLEEAEGLQRKKKEKQQQSVLINEDKDTTSTKASHLKNFQKLRPCDICGLSLSLLDSDERLADHFAGKLHIGWAMIRKKYKELLELRTSASSSSAQSASRNNKRDRSYSPGGDRRRSRSPDRHRSRGNSYRGSNDRDYSDNRNNRDYYRDNDRNYRGRY